MIFVACSKDETSGGAGEADVATDNSLKSVTVTIPNISKAATRATGNAMKNESTVSLTNYKVIFLDASGNEVTIPGFDSDGDGVAEPQQVYFDSEATDNTGWDDNLGSGNAKTYHFLPAATSSVVVVGNLGDITYEGIADSYDVLNDGDAVASDSAGHPYYPLYGESALTAKGDVDEENHENVYTASVTLAPQIARFEIYGFEYILDDEYSTDFTFTQIDLDRIALSNYYTAYDLKTGTALGDLVAAPTDHAEVWTWIEELGTEDDTELQWFNTLLDPATSERLALGQGEAKYVNGTTLDPTTYEDGEETTNIVTFGVVDYETNGDEVYNPELLLSFYGDADGTATDLTPLYLRGAFNRAEAFQAGKIYRVLFPIIDGAWEQPERCVELTITVAEWAVEVVTPEF